MITTQDRRLAAALVQIGLWGVRNRSQDLFSCHRLRPKRLKWMTCWLWARMVKRQARDGLHHAPCCPGNEWSGVELVFQACTCGASTIARPRPEQPHTPEKDSG